MELDVPLPPFAEPPLVGEGGAVEEPEGSEAEEDVAFVPFRRIALRCDVTTQYRQFQDLQSRCKRKWKREGKANSPRTQPTSPYYYRSH